MRRNTYVDAEFFTRWSPAMAYVLGVVCTDGCLVEHANGYHCLNLTSKDLTWLRLLKRTLHASQRISRKRGGHQLQIRNQTLYRSLLHLGLTPRKSKTIRMPAVPSEVFSDFVRGCFDGDGCVAIWREPRWRHALQLRVSFVSASQSFVETLRQRLAAEAGLGQGSMWFGARAYSLRYLIEDGMRLSGFMYREGPNGLCLARKRRVFELFETLKQREAALRAESHRRTNSCASSNSPVDNVADPC